MLILITQQEIITQNLEDLQNKNKFRQMQSSSLSSSFSERQLDRSIDESYNTKSHLEKMTEKYIELIDQLTNDPDPKKVYHAAIQQKKKQMTELKQQNQRLLEKNRELQTKLSRALEEIKKLRSLQANESNQKYPKVQIQSPLSPKSESSQDYIDLGKIATQYQEKVFRDIEKAQLDAKQLSRQEQEMIRATSRYVQKVIDRLDRMVDLAKMNKHVNEVIDCPHQTVSVKKQKYQQLIDFYIQHAPFPQNNQSRFFKLQQQNNHHQLTQFSINQSPDMNLQPLNLILQNAEEYQKLFTQLAQRAGLIQQWQNYKALSRNEAQNFQLDLINIAESNQDPSNKQKIIQNINNINESIIGQASASLDETKASQKIKAAQIQLEVILFEKIKNIVERLPFKQTQKDLFERFYTKKQFLKLHDIDDFIHQFKEKQDLFQISNHYTIYMIRSMNLLTMKMMEILTETVSESMDLTGYAFPWLLKKLDAKSSEVKERLLNVIEREFSKYLQQKNPPKHPINQRKQIRPIVTPVFDGEKEFQKEIIRVVLEYRNILESSVVNSNRKFIVAF